MTGTRMEIFARQRRECTENGLKEKERWCRDAVAVQKVLLSRHCKRYDPKCDPYLPSSVQCHW